MGVTVTARNYNNFYRPEVVNWLIGNVGEWQQLNLECSFAVEAMITNESAVQLIVGNIVKREDGKDWSSFGFDIGNTIHLLFNGQGQWQDSSNAQITLTFSWDWSGRVITQLQGDEMTISGSDITSISILGADSGVDTEGSFNRLPYVDSKINTIKSMKIWSDIKPEGIDLIYGHVENSDAEAGVLNSFIDGSTTRLIALHTDSLGGYNFMEKVGVQSGMAIDWASWVFYNKNGDNEYRYGISLVYQIASFFDDLSNLEDRKAPDDLFDAKSLTDNFVVTGYPKWNNPNCVIRSDIKQTKRLGNTGWFGENFNGLKNDFVVKSLEYFDNVTGVPTQKISYGSETRVRAIVGGVQNMADGLSKYSLGFIWTPEDESYFKNLGTSFHENLMVSTCGASTSGVFPQSNIINPTLYQGFGVNPLNKMNVKNVRFMMSGTDLIYEAVFVPTAGFQNFIDSLDEVDRGYALWISVADRTLVTNFSNRVPLLLDYNKMDLFVPPVGAWTTMNIGFYEHPNDGLGAINSKCGIDFFVEDDILAKADFLVDITQPIPTAIEFALEVENTITGQKYNLESMKVDLTQFPVNGIGVPQWNFDDVRGFKLGSGNNKNFVKVQRSPLLDSGGLYSYTSLYGFKIRWEDWISRLGVPADFFDVLKENNGFNNDWFEYLGHAGWVFNYTVYTYSTQNGIPVKYVNSEIITFRDYNSNLNITKQWNWYRDSDNTLLNAGVDIITGEPLGVFLQNEKVRVEVVYTRAIGTWSSLADVYGTICNEVYKGAGEMQFRQLSSIWASESDNPLVPLVGETLTKVTLVSPTVVKLECLVEPSLLIGANRYKMSSRLGCKI